MNSRDTYRYADKALEALRRIAAAAERIADALEEQNRSLESRLDFEDEADGSVSYPSLESHYRHAHVPPPSQEREEP